MTPATAASPSSSRRTLASKIRPPPLGTIRPKVFITPRIWLESSVTMPRSCVRAPSRERTSMASRPLTRTSQYQPERTRCARPSASLASVLLVRMFSAALALRASRQVIGNPTSVSACHSQVVSVQPDAHRLRRMLADHRLDRLRRAGAAAAPDPLALIIQDMRLGFFQRDVQSDILTHGGSPRVLALQLQAFTKPGIAGGLPPPTSAIVRQKADWPEAPERLRHVSSPTA